MINANHNDSSSAEEQQEASMPTYLANDEESNSNLYISNTKRKSPNQSRNNVLPTPTG